MFPCVCEMFEKNFKVNTKCVWLPVYNKSCKPLATEELHFVSGKIRGGFERDLQLDQFISYQKHGFYVIAFLYIDQKYQSE